MFHRLFRSIGFRPTMRRRAASYEGIAVASFVGVASGFYIYQPLFQEFAENRAGRLAEEAAAAEGGSGGGNNSN